MTSFRMYKKNISKPFLDCSKNTIKQYLKVFPPRTKYPIFVTVCIQM